MESSNPLLAEYRPSFSCGEQLQAHELRDEKSTTPRKACSLRMGFSISLLLNFGLVALMMVQSLNGNPKSLGGKMSYDQMPQRTPDSNVTHSPFAGLQRNVPKQWNGHSFTTQEAWEKTWNSTSTYPGIVALSDSYALEKGLPRSQRWPWDSTRGIYVLNSHHNLHCLLNIKQTIEEYREGRPLTIHFAHVQHCLLVLREEIMCNADDTPRYSGYQEWGKTAYGQVRMCRNWTQLEEWAMNPQREGCWRPIPGILGDVGSDTSNHLLERYRFCSDLNPYKERAETMWRDPAAWED